MKIICDCLDKFCRASGAKVSIQKTKLFCSKSTPARLGYELSRISGFEKVESLDKYLEVQLFHGRVAKADYTYLVERAHQKLTG